MQFTRLAKKLLGIAAIVAVIGFFALPLTGCSQVEDGINYTITKDAIDSDINIEDNIIEENIGTSVYLIDVVADGSIFNRTTYIKLTFSDEIDGLSADDITFGDVAGVTKGTLRFLKKISEVEVIYILPVQTTTNVSLNVEVTKSDYNIVNESETVDLFYAELPDVEMAEIPAGTFYMGMASGEPNNSGEKQHQVTLTRSFLMGKYEVTQKQYQSVMGEFKPQSPYASTVYRADNYPVYISFCETLIFCNKLSMLEGLDPVYSIGDSTDPADWGTIPTINDLELNTETYKTWSGAIMDINKNGYRLPTEAEWEYACRGDYSDKATNKNTMPFGIGNGAEMLDGMANFNSKYPYKLEWSPYQKGETYDTKGITPSTFMPVGSYAPNSYGLYDMHGNVSEWCWDFFTGTGAIYNQLFVDGVVDPVLSNQDNLYGGARVHRGGYYGSSSRYVRSASRERNNALQGSITTGFRLVRTVVAPAS